MWQPERDPFIRKFHISWSLQEYRYQVPLYSRYGVLRTNKAPTYWYRWTGHWHFDKATRKGQIPNFLRTTWCHSETLLWESIMMYWALGAREGRGVLLGATCNHRVTHHPLVVHYVQGKGSTFPCDTQWWLWNRMISSSLGQDDSLSVVTVEQDDYFSYRIGWLVLHGIHWKGWFILLWIGWLVLLSRHPTHTVWDSWEVPLI